MKTRAPALRRAVHKPLPQAPAHATKPAPRRAATIRKKTKADASRMKAADRRRFVPARLPAAPRGNCLHFATWNVRPSPSDPSRSGWIFLVSFSFGDRVIHGRSKTLMRHCRVGHRRGSFKEKSYRDRVNAVLESVYGSTFSEGAWWYRHPDEDAFFASVFSMASGRAVTAAQAARVFVKNNETRKIELDETAMRAAGVSVAEVAALYEKTPAAAWIAETRGKRAAREAIVVPPLEGGEATAERSERSERSEKHRTRRRRREERRAPLRPNPRLLPRAPPIAPPSMTQAFEAFARSRHRRDRSGSGVTRHRRSRRRGKRAGYSQIEAMNVPATPRPSPRGRSVGRSSRRPRAAGDARARAQLCPRPPGTPRPRVRRRIRRCHALPPRRAFGLRRRFWSKTPRQAARCRCSCWSSTRTSRSCARRLRCTT